MTESSCEISPHPVYPEKQNSLKIEFRSEKDQHWKTAPGCLGWEKTIFPVEMAASGRFENSGGTLSILNKIAAVSKLSGLEYWSVSRKNWAGFIKQSFALSSADKKNRRADFTPEELKPGKPLFYLQDEATTVGEMIYQMKLLLADERRVLLALENITEPTFLGFTVFKQGDSQSFYLFEQLDNNDWGYYSLGRLRRTGFGVAKVTQASYANRATSIFRHFADLSKEDLPVFESN